MDRGDRDDDGRWRACSAAAEIIGGLERDIVRTARVDDPQSLARLKTIPGVGNILALTMVYEVHQVDRFPRVQEFASYCRLVRCQRQSGGKTFGTGGHKIGNVHLKWACSEAAVLFLNKCPDGKRLLARIERKHGKGKAIGTHRRLSLDTFCWPAQRPSAPSPPSRSAFVKLPLNSLGQEYLD